MSSLTVLLVVIFSVFASINGYSSIQPWFPGDHDSNYNYESNYHSQNSYTHPCKRECIYGQSLTCYYDFKVENYEVAGEICEKNNYDPTKGCIETDGIKTAIMTVNRKYPGQAIEVCENDTVIVDVKNHLLVSTIMHWHGINHWESPNMDGAPFTTQYPIQSGLSYRYKFKVQQHGTYWWHSHLGQRAYGLAGPLISRQPEDFNLHAHLYDYDMSEHILFVQDWSYNFEATNPKNILINGKGHNAETQFHDSIDRNDINYEKIKVIKGHRYRFRLIYNGNANCPIEVSIDNHNLLVISSDGQDMEPTTVKILYVLAGERYDFVLEANAAVANYWLRVKAIGFCAATEIHQGAIIQYKGAPNRGFPKQQLTYDFEVTGLSLNPIDVGPSDDPNKLTLVEVNGLRYTNYHTNQKFKTHYTSMGIYNRNGEFSFQLDGISMEMPTVSLLHARNFGIESTFCNKTSLKLEGKDCTQEHCRCTNVVQLKCHDYYEFVVSANTARGHPFHTHGYHFFVVGMGVLGQARIRDIEAIDKSTPLKRRNDRSPVYKDTVQVPGFGYVIIRFYTDNCGYWMAHCHWFIHEDDGMLMILKVGENHEMVKTPKDNCFRDDDYNHYYNKYYNKK